MQRKAVYGKWQRKVQKALLKRSLQNKNNQRGDTAAKTAEQQDIPAHNIH